MADSSTKAEKPVVAKAEKPDKPDEAAYNKELDAANKAFEAAKVRLVCS